MLVGSAAYNSTITNHTEVLPVSVDVIGKRPFDLLKLLFHLCTGQCSTYALTT